MGEQVAAGTNKKAKFFARKKLCFFIRHGSVNGGVAQLGEHLPCKQGVMSSNLTISTLAMRSGNLKSQTGVKLACKTE